MSNDTRSMRGCSDELAQLCALATTDELSEDELQELREHVAGCSACAILMHEYSILATSYAHKLGPHSEVSDQVPETYDESKAERRLMAAIRVSQADASRAMVSQDSVPCGALHGGNRLAFALGAAAVLVLCMVGAFQLGRKTEARTSSNSAVHVATSAPRVEIREDTALQRKLSDAEKSLEEITARSSTEEKQITDLSNAKAALFVQIHELTEKSEAKSESLLAVTQQRDAIERQLNDTSKALEQVKQDLNQNQKDRQEVLARIASLEEENVTLRAEASKANVVSSENEQFLARDRDIRELMGARQLYIADVFDVQNDGKRSKPFGRVFYTEGKSLIFYAFDLQSQPGYQEAKAFQAWGKPDRASGTPVSLGIFYTDSEKNRRWVLKSDNPDILAQINSVFVTVEPRGGSDKPTGKPFLQAYLHSLAPNHP